MVNQDGETGQGEGRELAPRADTRPRRRESTLLRRISTVRNVETLLGSARETGVTLPRSRPTAREEQAPKKTKRPKKRRLPAERHRESITGR